MASKRNFLRYIFLQVFPLPQFALFIDNNYKIGNRKKNKRLKQKTQK
jgi:hypothetical protein